jgi:hypothetical protein
MAGSIIKVAKKRADKLLTMPGKTVLPTFTAQTEAQEEADRLNVINQLIIGAKERIVKADQNWLAATSPTPSYKRPMEVTTKALTTSRSTM